jgi:Ca2+-binding RTX toxin-like protein
LSGLNGDDILFGGVGNDVLTGGQGQDRFVLAAATGTDTFSDFSADDLIGLSGGFGFGDLAFSGNDILLSSRNEVLATLTGVDTTTLQSAQFVLV